MAEVIESTRASEGSTHWYTRDGKPCYTVIGANGKERNTTLRDARKELLCPSVTTIINEAAKPALIQWMQRQVLLAALTLPRLPDENDEAYCARIMEDSKAQGKEAAEEGTRIHAAIEQHYGGQDFDHKYADHVFGVRTSIRLQFQVDEFHAEHAFSHPLGFGGKTDLHGQSLVLDVKSKDFYELPTKENKIKLWWDENVIQLAAYRVGLGMPNATCGNVYVSRTVPGLVHIHVWGEDELERGWEMFKALLQYWTAKTGYKSGWIA
jgi:hypothetical protein